MTFPTGTLTLTNLGTTTLSMVGVGPLYNQDSVSTSGAFNTSSDDAFFMCGSQAATVAGGTVHWFNQVAYWDMGASTPDLVVRNVTPTYSGTISGTVYSTVAGGVVLGDAVGGSQNFSGVFGIGERPFASGTNVSPYLTPAFGVEESNSGLTASITSTYTAGPGDVLNFPAVSRMTPIYLDGELYFVADPSANSTQTNAGVACSGTSYLGSLTFLPGLYAQGFTSLEAEVFPITDSVSQKTAFVLCGASAVGFTSSVPIVEIVSDGLALQGDYQLSFGLDTVAAAAWASQNASPGLSATRSGMLFGVSGSPTLYLVNFFSSTYEKFILTADSGFDEAAVTAIEGAPGVNQSASIDRNGVLWVSNGGITPGDENVAVAFYFAKASISGTPAITLNPITALNEISPSIGGGDFESPNATQMDYLPGTVGGGTGNWTTIPEFVGATVSGGAWTGFGPSQPYGTYTLQVRNHNITSVVSNTETYVIAPGPPETIFLASAQGTLGGTVELTGTTNYGPPLWIDVSLDNGQTWTTAEYYETANGTYAAPYYAVGPILTTDNGV